MHVELCLISPFHATLQVASGSEGRRETRGDHFSMHNRSTQPEFINHRTKGPRLPLLVSLHSAIFLLLTLLVTSDHSSPIQMFNCSPWSFAQRLSTVFILLSPSRFHDALLLFSSPRTIRSTCGNVCTELKRIWQEESLESKNWIWGWEEMKETI